MPPTSTRLDWLSFTLEVDPEDALLPRWGGATELAKYIKGRLGLTVGGTEPIAERGRYPYRMSVSGDGLRVFWTPGTFEILVEISGEGCEALEPTGALEALVREHLGNLTRVDLATDIVTETDPIEFAEMRTNKRHKSHETAVSPTGTTVYIGSRRSDRYTRVYRYAKPHPRSDRLRIECVFRGHQAIALATTWLEEGNEETAARAGNTYGWCHPDWTPKSQNKIEAWRPDRKTHNRSHWYHSQVVPALKRMIREGLLTKEQLICDVSEKHDLSSETESITHIPVSARTVG